MIKNIIFYSFLGLTVITLFYYFTATSSSEYSESITKHHEEQERHLTEGDSLNITKKLNYFAVNEKYITTAKVTLINPQNSLNVRFTENEDSVLYIRIAYLEFKLNNVSHLLTLFKNNANNDYILPFTDSTNSKQTHKTGRYLPINFHYQEYIDIDFNMAYNPYCAYNPEYACAITPKENHIPINIRAGQLRY